MQEHKKGSRWDPLGYWSRLGWRWKMTLLGFGIGMVSSSLSTTPGAVIALSRGYTAHGIVYVVVTILGVTLFTGIMCMLGTRHERDMNGEE